MRLSLPPRELPEPSSACYTKDTNCHSLIPGTEVGSGNVPGALDKPPIVSQTLFETYERQQTVIQWSAQPFERVSPSLQTPIPERMQITPHNPVFLPPTPR